MARTNLPDSVALVVAERTPTAFWAALRRAEKSARVVELRLDYLGSVAEIVGVLEKLARRPSRLTLIATCRRRADGGEFGGSPSAQLALLELAVRAGCRWVDVEAATLEAFPRRLRGVFLRSARRIVSRHNFKRTPANLPALYRRLKQLRGELVKIAALARTHRDAVRMLELARRHRRRVVALPMGTVGIPGRVLSLRAGSALAYAAPDVGTPTAPGQLSWSELRARYRAPKLNARTRVYGVIGQPILHSLSPPMHNAAFVHARLNAVYLPFEVANVKDFLACLKAYRLAGFSVTAPHKQAILRHLDEIDPLAEMIGAVNTVVVGRNGRLSGFNTDYVGVLRTLQRYIHLERSQVLLVGAGGSARACAFALATAGAFVCVTSRRAGRARALARAVGGEAVPRQTLARRRFDAIVNCTPVGQAPYPNATPLAARELNTRVLFDLVYNPPQTRLLREARRRGVRTVPGWQMLVEQGAAQFEIWTERRAPLQVMRRVVLNCLRTAER